MATCTSHLTHPSEAKNQNATIRSRFPQERITPIFRPISVAFQIQGDPTASPSVGPVGGFNPSPSPRFPDTFGDLIKLSLSDSRTLLRDYDIAEDPNGNKTAEEARLDNLNKLMVHFGVRVPPSSALPSFSHRFWTRRLGIACILGRRGKGR